MKRTRRFKASFKSKKRDKKTKSRSRLRGGINLQQLNLKEEEEKEPTVENYLANVVIKNENTNLENVIIKQQLVTFLTHDNNPNYFSKMFNDIRSAIPQTVSTFKKFTKNLQSFFTNQNSVWVDCIGQCEKVCLSYITQEIESTAYMLRILTKSVVSGSNVNKNVNNGITFTYINSAQPLTGKWYDDKNKFQMNFPSSMVGTGRLIMGFGPSSSGKTRNAEGVILLMQAIIHDFPNLFYTVDGGEFRKLSVVYQTIIKAVASVGKYTGLTNLVLAGISPLLTNLFAAGKIKKNVLEYFKMQKLRRFNINNNPFKINLYVPDTLGSCILETTCAKTTKEYIDLTGDMNWIGLMIYQHYKKCPYPVPFTCPGTLASGLKREKTEGKQYSGAMWYNSYLNGNDAIEHAPNYRFRLHNCINCESIFEDLSPTPLLNNPNVNFPVVHELMVKQKWRYFAGKYKNSFDAAGYQTIMQEENERLRQQPQPQQQPQQYQQPQPQQYQQYPTNNDNETFV